MTLSSRELDISKLALCLKALEECYSEYTKNNDSRMKEFLEDACVKRFEFSLEISWKTMKRFLKLEYSKNDTELTMNNIFRFMEHYGFVKSWTRWRTYYTERNNTAHEYDQKKARSLLAHTQDLISDMEYLYDKLSKVITD